MQQFHGVSESPVVMQVETIAPAEYQQRVIAALTHLAELVGELEDTSKELQTRLCTCNEAVKLVQNRITGLATQVGAQVNSTLKDKRAAVRRLFDTAVILVCHIDKSTLMLRFQHELCFATDAIEVASFVLH